MARFSHAAQDRRVLTITVWEEALGPDMSTIQVYPADPYRSHPNPSPTRRPRPDAYVAGAAARRAALAHRVRLVSQMAGAGAVRPLAGGCRPPTPPSRGPQGGASPEHHRYAGGQVHPGARSPGVRRRQEGARAQARGPG